MSQTHKVTGKEHDQSWLAQMELEWWQHYRDSFEAIWECARPTLNPPMGKTVVYGTTGGLTDQTPMVRSKADPHMSFGFGIMDFNIMQTYIGTKIIKARPMTAGAAEQVLNRDIKGAHQDEDKGYLVEYPDGYKSWSPMKAFKESYRPTDGMPFGLAVEAMKKGKKVTRHAWLAGEYLTMEEFDSDKLSEVDILADDWEVIE